MWWTSEIYKAQRLIQDDIQNMNEWALNRKIELLIKTSQQRFESPKPLVYLLGTTTSSRSSPPTFNLFFIFTCRLMFWNCIISFAFFPSIPIREPVFLSLKYTVSYEYISYIYIHTHTYTNIHIHILRVNKEVFPGRILLHWLSGMEW